MKNAFLALFLALALLPVAAMADDQGPPGGPSLTPQQRQAMFQTFHTFMQKEEQLHQQFRAQILRTLTPAHRTAVADLFGQLAISSNPDPASAARQLDSILTQSERQQILSEAANFKASAKSLHEQLRSQMKSEFPAPPHPEQQQMRGGMEERHETAPDAGMILLRTLGEFKPMGMEHHFMMTGGPQPPR